MFIVSTIYLYRPLFENVFLPRFSFTTEFAITSTSSCFVCTEDWMCSLYTTTFSIGYDVCAPTPLSIDNSSISVFLYLFPSCFGVCAPNIRCRISISVHLRFFQRKLITGSIYSGSSLLSIYPKYFLQAAPSHLFLEKHLSSSC